MYEALSSVAPLQRVRAAIACSPEHSLGFSQADAPFGGCGGGVTLDGGVGGVGARVEIGGRWLRRGVKESLQHALGA